MNPQNRKSLNLNRWQQKLFDDHLKLAHIAAGRYRRFCPPTLFDELLQDALIGLAHTAKHYDPNDPGEFGALAWTRIRSRCISFLFSRQRFRSAALKNAEKHERSADDPLGVNEDGEKITRGTVALNKHGRKEVQSDIAADNLASRLFDIKAAVQSLKTLTVQERRVLSLRYQDGLGLDRIAARLKFSQVKAKRLCRSAIGKLRNHFADLGALAPSAPLPKDNVPQEMTHWHWKRPPRRRHKSS